MPLLEEISDIANTRLLIWDMSDSESPTDIPDLPEHIHHPKRIREYVSTRQMKTTLGIFEPISHYDNGKPYIEGGPHISISHGAEIAGFIRSDNPVGLDIQKPTPQLVRIRTKFCHPDELKDAANSGREEHYLTLLWSAKEAVFKLYGEGLAFAEQIRIGPLDENRQVALAMVYRNNQSTLHEIRWKWLRNHAIVWSI